MGIIIIQQHSLMSPDDLGAFVAACQEVERVLRLSDVHERLLRFWLYGVSPADRGRVTTVAGLPSLAAYSPWLKSRAWKQFRRTIEPLVQASNQGRSDVTVAIDALGAGWLPTLSTTG